MKLQHLDSMFGDNLAAIWVKKNQIFNLTHSANVNRCRLLEQCDMIGNQSGEHDAREIAK